MAGGSRIGEILGGKYRLDEELGRGGMGAVYRAFHQRVHKEFAVKVLNAEMAEKKSIAARLVLEAQAAGRIGHPGILDVYDVGEDDEGRPFLVMELLRGETLSSVIARGPLSGEMACWVASQLLELLDAAHRAGVVHRDVKPQNVFLVAPSDDAPEGPRTLKLLDFGIAKFHLEEGSALTGSGEIMGSPLYMAPEQAQGEHDVDARADVWSVGAMLFEMLTGKPAHAAPNAIAVLAKILTETAPPVSSTRPDLPAAIDAVVRRALVIDRGERFASAREMHDALLEARAACGWSDAPPSFPAPPRRASRTSTPSTPTPSTPSGPAKVKGATPQSSPTVREGAPRDAVMASAVTAAKTRSTSRKRVGVVIAAAALACGAAIPIVTPGFGVKAEGGAAARELESAAATATATPTATLTATPTPSATPSATPTPSATDETSSRAVPDIAGDAGARVEADAGRRAVPARRVESTPACAAGEVLSEGHCCPGGHVWQSGRCERPLATSF